MPKDAVHISVLFFGATAAALDERRLERAVPAGTTASDLITNIVADYPALSGYKLLISINQEYATGGEMFRDGDEVGIFTAVSGG